MAGRTRDAPSIDDPGVDPVAPQARALSPWAGALIAAACAAAVWTLADEPENPCAATAPLLDGVWDTRTKAELADAFAAADLSYATDTWDHTEDLLEAYANAWTAAHRETCEATQVHHTQSDARMRLRMACLMQRRDALWATVDVLRAPDPTVVRGAGRAARALPALDTCADGDAQEAVALVPSEHDENVASLRVRQAIARANLEAGKIHRGRDLARAVLQQAETLELPAVLAEAHALMAAASSAFGQWDDARAHAQAGLAAAIAARDDHSAAALAVATVTIDSHWPPLGVAHPHTEHAIAWVERVGSPPQVQAALLNARGRIARRKARFYDAIGFFEESLSVLADDADPDLIETRGLLAQTYSEMGDDDAAVALFEVNLRAIQATLGAHHPALAKVLSDAAAVLEHQHKWTQAQAYYERALKIRTEAFGVNSAPVGATLTALASLQMSAGNYGESLSLCGRAVELAPDRIGRLALLEMVGALHARLGRPNEAARTYQRVISLGDASPGSGHALVVSARYNLARNQLARGNHAQALGLVTTALQDLADAGRHDPAQRSALLAFRSELHARGDGRRATDRAMAVAREKE